MKLSPSLHRLSLPLCRTCVLSAHYREEEKVLVLACKSQRTGSSAQSVRSVEVVEETMTCRHWLGLMLCIPFSALIVIGWVTERIFGPKETCTTCHQRLSNGTMSTYVLCIQHHHILTYG